MQNTEFALPKNKAITISVINGPSKGLALQLGKPRISIGAAGSDADADMQISDPKASRLHCAVGVTEGQIRLCDLDSLTGTWVDEKRVQSAELEHLSEFRIGSSLFLVTVMPKLEVKSETTAR